MSQTASFGGRVRMVGLAIAVGPLLAGCSSDRSYRLQPDITNIVRRPVYEVEGDKTLYLGGYAGANYDYGARPGR